MSENTNGCLTRRKFINLMLKAGAAAAMGWTRIEALRPTSRIKGSGLHGLLPKPMF
jgi:hypothetical protein